MDPLILTASAIECACLQALELQSEARPNLLQPCLCALLVLGKDVTVVPPEEKVPLAVHSYHPTPSELWILGKEARKTAADAHAQASAEVVEDEFRFVSRCGGPVLNLVGKLDARHPKVARRTLGEMHQKHRAGVFFVASKLQPLTQDDQVGESPLTRPLADLLDIKVAARVVVGARDELKQCLDKVNEALGRVVVCRDDGLGRLTLKVLPELILFFVHGHLLILRH
mmetsp:Transcript_4824/g.11529  ORF Transcript_4824/g.11529 Transcript_4824/m.11529 type:complete len:227 (-) Transcript_4824:273-953(-)